MTPRLILTIVLLFFCSPASAQTVERNAGHGHHGDHGVGHASNHAWYQALKRPDREGSCCSNNDCRPTDAKYDNQTRRWSAIKDGRWVVIPPEKIVETDVPAEAGSDAHLCAPPASWSGFAKDEVFCFIRPNGGT